MTTESSSEALIQYKAFISYSHADQAIAKRIHRELENFRPARSLGRAFVAEHRLPSTLAPIFLDREEFASAARLDDAIQEALSKSAALLVLCSPRSGKSDYVDEEIRRFKALGRGNRVFALILSGEPNAQSRGFDPALECFPPALTKGFDDRGEPTGESAEPLAADLRPTGDGWRAAMQKTIAGILDIDYDRLRQRRRAQSKRRRAVAAVASLAAVLLAAIVYLAAADAGAALPLADAVREEIDARRASALRPVHSRDRIRKEALRLADQYREFALADPYHEKVAGDPEAPMDYRYFWQHAQCVAALGRREPNDDAASAGAALAQRLEAMRARFGFVTAVDPNEYSPMTEPLAWAATALAQYAKQRRLDEEEQAILALAVRGLADDYSDGQGRWSTFRDSRTEPPEGYYPATLALAALVESLQSGTLPNDVRARAEETVRKTCLWLVDGYETIGTQAGWRGRAGLREPLIADGLTLQIYAELLSAQRLGLVEFPPALVDGMVDHLIRCGDRPIDYPTLSIEIEERVETAPGVVRPQLEFVNLLWWPWAIEATRLALERSETLGLTGLETYRLERTLSRLIVDQGPEILEREIGDGNLTYMIGEEMWALYGFQRFGDE